MDRLIAELQRLYFLPGQGGLADPVSPEGRVRALAVVFEKSADWEGVERLFQGVQEDLDLPAPAVSVSGSHGFQVWFSLAEPVPVEEARTFLDALRLRYLGDLPAAHLKFHFGGAAGADIALIPALCEETGKWSAFIDPAMGSMFKDEPGLEMGPNPGKQAELLSRFESIKAADFRRAMDRLKPADSPGGPVDTASRSGGRLDVGSNFSDPKSFLLAVMNDPSASPDLRIEAAKALLPYFEEGKP